jgi:hypothetical protein
MSFGASCIFWSLEILKVMYDMQTLKILKVICFFHYYQQWTDLVNYCCDYNKDYRTAQR